MKNYLLLLLCVILHNSSSGALNAFAKNAITLSGKVTKQDGSPISQALIAIEGSSLGTYSDSKGNYTLVLNSGVKYQLYVSFLGFKTIKNTILSNKNQVIDFILKKDVFSLGEVAIKAKSKSSRMREGLFSVNSLTVKDNTNTSNNLNNLVNKSSGIKIRENGGVGSDFDLSINGLSGNSVRYFIDGIPLNTMGSGINLSNLPVNLVERIEVFKGVVPTHLGADALGGAINIITTKRSENYLDVSYGLGSFNTHKFNLNGQYIVGKNKLFIKPILGYILSDNNYLMKGVEVWDEEAESFNKKNRKRFHNKYNSLLGQIDFSIKNKSWCDNFILSTSFSTKNKELQTGSTQKIVYGKAERENEDYKISVQYKKKRFLDPKLSTHFLLSFTSSHSTVIDTAYRKYDWNGDFINSYRNEIGGRGKSIRHIKRPLITARTNFDYKFNEFHSLNFNYLLSHLINRRSDDFDFDFEETKDSFSKNILGLSYKQRFFNDNLVNSFFIKDYFSILNVKQLDLAWITGSEDKIGKTSTNEWGYGMGTRYKFSEELFIKTSFEHSLRLPLAREILGNGITVYPNLKLKPEIGDNYNIGLLGNISINKNHTLNYETNLFLRQTKNYIRLVISETEGLSQYDNVSSVKIKGIESELSYSYKNAFKLKGNISYLDERSNTKFQDNGKPEITYNNRMPNRPWLYGNIGVQLNKENIFGNETNLRIEYDFQYVHWFYLTWEGYGSLKSKSTIPSQSVSDVTISYAFEKGKYNLSLRCSNIFDQLVYDRYMLQKPGKSFFLKFRIFIN